ncbi:MAG: response regulator [bacterium]|nr:response regulator [bacterium]
MKDKIRIYVLDDSITVTTYIEKSLHALGYTVYADNNPSKCLSRIKEFFPDLIILDIDMNEYNGLDICRQIQKDDSLASIPIIFLSNITDTNVVAEGIEAGAVDYVVKPVDINQLDARIKILFKILDDTADELKLAKMNMVKAAIITMHHELNQPLSVILLSAEMLESRLAKNLEKKDEVLLSRIKNSVEKINDILRRFNLIQEQDKEPELVNYSEDSMMLKLPKSTYERKVLVIDDEEDVRKTITEVISQEGIDVLEAKSIKEADDIIKRQGESISTIFCDIKIGKESGTEILHLSRKLYPNIKFIFITGFNISGDVKLLIKEFKIPLLRKPFSKKMIAALLRHQNG